MWASIAFSPLFVGQPCAGGGQQDGRSDCWLVAGALRLHPNRGAHSCACWAILWGEDLVCNLALTNDGSKVLDLCKRTGFASDRVRFVPISAYTADNVITKSKHMAWWTGPTLLQSMLETIQTLPVWANPRRRLALVRTSPSLLSLQEPESG